MSHSSELQASQASRKTEGKQDCLWSIACGEGFLTEGSASCTRPLRPELCQCHDFINNAGNKANWKHRSWGLCFVPTAFPGFSAGSPGGLIVR